MGTSLRMRGELCRRACKGLDREGREEGKPHQEKFKGERERDRDREKEKDKWSLEIATQNLLHLLPSCALPFCPSHNLSHNIHAE